jgi:hypothetical protein
MNDDKFTTSHKEQEQPAGVAEILAEMKRCSKALSDINTETGNNFQMTEIILKCNRNAGFTIGEFKVKFPAAWKELAEGVQHGTRKT